MVTITTSLIPASEGTTEEEGGKKENSRHKTERKGLNQSFMTSIDWREKSFQLEQEMGMKEMQESHGEAVTCLFMALLREI